MTGTEVEAVGRHESYLEHHKTVARQRFWDGPLGTAAVIAGLVGVFDVTMAAVCVAVHGCHL